eukprot:gnl/Spiro4/6836_TR3542_c0_g1_i1.p3 gnl/Spiro4/6836_TR3542_c0_g1~~gnl/Spiro4/6836_TR3542_c0_g1_i1.p3  ORF type:complete len:110 (-),score=34.25 gnl/Spiro4/6836_TR3542_c0_g1_i1:114-419(-)
MSVPQDTRLAFFRALRDDRADEVERLIGQDPSLVHSFSSLYPPVHGYTTTQLLKDQRFKLTVAFQNAGMYDAGLSNYARQALVDARPAQAPRRDMTHTQQQ